MNRDSFNIGNIRIRVNNLFYGLLILSVACSFIISIANALRTHNDIFTVLTSVVIFTLCTIGSIAVILEVAKRWRIPVGIIVIGFALYFMVTVPAAYNFEYTVFYHSPLMITLQTISSLCWLISGIILILNKSIITKDEAVSSELSE